jgi:hypothetical protein
MFRLLRVKPPNGWSAVVWELVIVTIGVLFALAAQQWVEGLSWRDRAAASMTQIREELSRHYANAVEWRSTYPCIDAQIDRLRTRLQSSGATMDPTPIYREGDYAYVLRIPSKVLVDTAWQAAISDGVTSRFDPVLRRELSQHYSEIGKITEMTRLNDLSRQRLATMASPLPIDPMVRFTLLSELETLSGRAEFLNNLFGRLIEHVQKVDMVPSADEARSAEGHGTYRFCKAQRLPMRSFEEAVQAAPN